MSGLLETQRAGKCDYEIDRIWVVVKLHTILGGYASSRWTSHQEPTLVYVQYVEDHFVVW